MRRFHINNLKLRNKLVVIYFLCVFIPILLTNVVFYNVTTNNIRNQKAADAELSLEQLQNELRVVIEDAAGSAYLYYIDPVLNSHLNQHYETNDQYIASLAAIRSIFNRSEKEYKTISSTLIMTDNPTILTSGNIISLNEEVLSLPWYEEFSANNNSYPYLYVTEKSISIIQALDTEQTSKYEHLIKIDLNMDYVKQLMELSSFQGNVYFMNDKNSVHYSNDAELSLVAGPISFSEIKQPQKALTFSKTYYNNRYLGGWSLYGVVDEEQILSEVSQTAQFIVLLAIINFVVPTMIITMISSSIHVRVKKILSHMKKVKGKNFEQIPYDRARDEIGELSVEFNRMIERIDNLINDVYVADIQKKDLEIRQRQAQLHALHSQINPHFLFNALETIRMRSLMKGESETARTIQNMGKIFRKSISWKKSFVTIREEIELIESFLEIQKYRFGDKLQFQITVEDALNEQLIPKMTFLPFVENASIHGIESNPGIGLITIQIAHEAQSIVFVISDNGMGMSEHKLGELQAYFSDDQQMGDNVGMKNVFTRLRIVYGDEFTYKMESEVGAGTRIMLRLPMKELE
ncbi:MAG TPA: sensor histidine kinase [Candidatus Paenibacillus intestinavium]|nr:sensor histidine kinase [Candidatus Paenibacillus intestinavium]